MTDHFDTSLSKDPILQVRHLCTHFLTGKGEVKAVNDISFSLDKGKTLALVGESGCGKSVTALSIMRLVSHPGRIVGGGIHFEGRNLMALSDREMCDIRGNRISMVFQEPMTSLNPVFRIGYQISELYFRHQKLSRREARIRAIELLARVGIPAPEKRIDDFPHQLSGGMRQRVMIAMALAAPGPGLLIADEPTTALDVTIQAQILKLMRELQAQTGTSLLLITHDMGVVAQMADRVAVLYAGRKVEEGHVYDLFETPRHPYTIGLLNSIPSNPKYRGAKRLEAVTGVVPNLLELGPGCPFENRCAHARSICGSAFPEARTFDRNQKAYCHFAGELRLAQAWKDE
jgi:oligopeptide/dipeptide ABC transporter ATP-binding protein